MEGVEIGGKDEALKSHIAIRCAKAAILLSSLKSFPNRHLKASNNCEAQEKEIMMRKIEDLRMALARERLKSKRIKLCSLMEVFLQVITVLTTLTLFLMLVFNHWRK